MSEITADEVLDFIGKKGLEDAGGMNKQELKALIDSVKGSPFLAVYIAMKAIALGAEKK